MGRPGTDARLPLPRDHRPTDPSSRQERGEFDARRRPSDGGRPALWWLSIEREEGRRRSGRERIPEIPADDASRPRRSGRRLKSPVSRPPVFRPPNPQNRTNPRIPICHAMPYPANRRPPLRRCPDRQTFRSAEDLGTGTHPRPDLSTIGGFHGKDLRLVRHPASSPVRNRHSDEPCALSGMSRRTAKRPLVPGPGGGRDPVAIVIGLTASGALEAPRMLFAQPRSRSLAMARICISSVPA